MRQALRTAVVILVLLSPACVAAAGPADLVEPVPGGRINWTRRVVQAAGTGTAAPKAVNTATQWETAVMNARRAAYGHLLRAIKQLRLSDRWRVEDVVDGNDRMLAKIESLLKSASVMDIIYSSAGTVEVILQMPVAGALSQLILPEYVVQLEIKNLGQASPDSENEGFTGLVVDARGVDVRPAMCFTVFDESGRDVYGPAYVSREFVVQKGMCGYVTDISAAEKSDQVGHNPLVVKALSARRPAGTDLVISSTDASRLRGAVQNLFFLRECRVIVVRRPFE